MQASTRVQPRQPRRLIFIENEQPVKSLWKHCIVERLRRDLRAAVGTRHHRCFFGNERFAAEKQPARLWSVPSALPKLKKSTVLAACDTAGFSWQVKCFPWSFYNRAFACFPTMPNWWADSAAYCIMESHITGRLFTACLAWVLNFALFIDQNWGRRKEGFELLKMTEVLRFALVQWSKF